ncbi:hypothetical protein ANO11243_008400 [Dothideomycetidae sp. 11243]|nr:hypothetical protein ANO11243_008400 [fungal sp. No.11243]
MQQPAGSAPFSDSSSFEGESFTATATIIHPPRSATLKRSSPDSDETQEDEDAEEEEEAETDETAFRWQDHLDIDRARSIGKSKWRLKSTPSNNSKKRRRKSKHSSSLTEPKDILIRKWHSNIARTADRKTL